MTDSWVWKPGTIEGRHRRLKKPASYSFIVIELGPKTPYFVSKSRYQLTNLNEKRIQNPEACHMNGLSDMSIVIKFLKEIFTFLKLKYLIVFANIRQWSLSSHIYIVHFLSHISLNPPYC